MILIQDGSQNTNVDKPLRIIGDPYKVQVSAQTAWSLEGSTVRSVLVWGLTLLLAAAFFP